MATTYHYYYIGDRSDGDGDERLPKLLTFSEVKNGPAGETKPHSHTHLEIFFFESGKGYFESGKQRIVLTAGDLLIVNAGVRHVQYSDSETSLVYACFSAACTTPLIQESFVHLADDSGELSALVNACRRELQGVARERFAAVHALFRLLVIGLLRRIVPQEAAKEQSVIDRVKTYIKTHCDEDISLDELAEQFYISKNTLLHAFKRELNTSPMQYRNAYRIERAMLLLSGGMGVTDAALAVGFSNPVYFAEVFKKHTGTTPSAYKKADQGAPKGIALMSDACYNG